VTLARNTQTEFLIKVTRDISPAVSGWLLLFWVVELHVQQQLLWFITPHSLWRFKHTHIHTQTQLY